MAKTRGSSEPQSERTKLAVSKEYFKAELKKAINAGRDLLNRPVSNEEQVKEFKYDCSSWNAVNVELLKSSFNNAWNEYWKEYDNAGSMAGFYNSAMSRGNLHPLEIELLSNNERLESKLQNLIQLLKKVDYMLSLIENSMPNASYSNENPLINLHAKVIEAAGSLFANGHYNEAILKTYIALSNAVQNKSQLKEDNTPLMRKAFSVGNPVLKISDDSGEQEGFMHLYEGAMMAIRNPKAHKVVDQTDPQRTLEWLSFASVLFRVLEDSQKS